MSKQLKSLITDALRSRYEGVNEACVVNVSGLKVQEAIAVRRELLTKNMRLRVIKNSLARRAFVGGPLEALSVDLAGPCALVTGGDTAIDMAREMVRLAEEFPAIGLKKGQMEDDPSLIPVADIAKMMGKQELLGEIAMLISSPGRAIADGKQSMRRPIVWPSGLSEHGRPTQPGANTEGDGRSDRRRPHPRGSRRQG